MTFHKNEDWEDDFKQSSDEESSDDESVASLILIKDPAKPTQRCLFARTTSIGLAIPTQQQLLQEIENKGGLTEFSKKRYALKELCDKKTDIYGDTGSTLRRQVQDKVKHWRKLTEIHTIPTSRFKSWCSNSKAIGYCKGNCRQRAPLSYRRNSAKS